MSTQRREDLRQRLSCTECRGGLAQILHILLAMFDRAIARVGTAPPETADLLATARLATNSLQSDYRITQFVRFVRLAREGIRHGSHSSPPSRAGDRAVFGIPATPRSSHLHIPSPSGFASLSPALP
jgi:hypothetical protein